MPPACLTTAVAVGGLGPTTVDAGACFGEASSPVLAPLDTALVVATRTDRLHIQMVDGVIAQKMIVFRRRTPTVGAEECAGVRKPTGPVQVLDTLPGLLLVPISGRVGTWPFLDRLTMHRGVLPLCRAPGSSRYAGASL